MDPMAYNVVLLQSKYPPCSDLFLVQRPTHNADAPLCWLLERKQPLCWEMIFQSCSNRAAHRLVTSIRFPDAGHIGARTAFPDAPRQTNSTSPGRTLERRQTSGRQKKEFRDMLREENERFSLPLDRNLQQVQNAGGARVSNTNTF